MELLEQTLEDFSAAAQDSEHMYHEIAIALLEAYQQASIGKGAARHAQEKPFRLQRMQSLAKGQGHWGGLSYQVCKKVQEAERLPTPEQRIAEVHGAIVYCAGIITYIRNEVAEESGGSSISPQHPKQ